MKQHQDQHPILSYPAEVILQNAQQEEDISFDIQQIQLAKQKNIQQAFETNLRSKKQEILRLEADQLNIQKEQEVKLIKLRHLKNQRDFY